MRLRSESEIRKKVSLSNYTTFLQKHYPKKPQPHKEYECNPKTGSCGFHGWFTEQALGVELTGDERLVHTQDIPSIVSLLDKGHVLHFLHNYLEGDKVYFDMPKDNRYDTHVFVLVKGGDRYFLSQGFLHVYKHSLTSFSREEIIKMLDDIVNGLSDFDKTKKWSEIDAGVYKKYFKANLGLNEKTPFQPHRKVNGIGLFMWKTRPLTSKIE